MHGPEITFFFNFYACFYEECGERNNKTSNSFLAFLSLSEHRLESWSREISSFCQYFGEFFPKTIRQEKKKYTQGLSFGIFPKGVKGMMTCEKIRRDFDGWSVWKGCLAWCSADALDAKAKASYSHVWHDIGFFFWVVW